MNSAETIAEVLNRMSLCEHMTYWLSRMTCRFDYHSLACRGRVDHDPKQGRWTSRW